MLVNTQYFRQPAIYYEKHKYYPCGKKDTEEYKQWWRDQIQYCLFGYSVGGTWIPGYYYYYLNFCPIQIVEKVGNRSSKRISGFPKFWDVDYLFFMSAHIARYGIPQQYLENDTIPDYFSSLPISIPITQKKENLTGGRHLLWLKPRGVGASFKAGSMTSRNYHLVKNSKTFLFADQKEYLTKDGLYSKFIDYMDWINLNTEFAEYHEIKGDRNNMHFINSYKDELGKIKGKKSEVLGTAITNDADKARGKRGQLALFEEGGRFGSLTQSWNIFRNSVEEADLVYGLMIAFGTGGTEGADFEGMELMFNNPDAYNLLCFDNIYDLGMEGTDCGMFTPAYKNIQYIDKNGNSNIIKGKEIINEQYEKAKKSPDSTLLNRRKAELPSTPQEAMLNTTANKFSSEGLVLHRNLLFSNATFRQFGEPKLLYRDENGKILTKTKFDHVDIPPPVVSYPHKKSDDLRGCVVEYATPLELPSEEGGKYIPDNLYFICHDPYADDDAEDTTSIGSCYVMMNVNNISSHDVGDRIVASYNGRPRTTDEYNEIMFMLAERWNAKIGFENDRGDVVGYAKRFKKLHWLAEEFELGWDEQIKVKNPSKVKYGMRMGSGKLNVKILTGDKYIQEWINSNRGINAEGGEKCNYHLIYDLGLLDELRMYNGKRNTDRISALRIGMYYMREFAYSDIKPTKKKKTKESFTKFMHSRRFQK